MVIDITKFIPHHPGGKFVLLQNIGRDISKFFYGGYSLENNLGPKPSRGYAHSNYARTIVNSLIIGIYDKQVKTETTECYVDRKKTEMWNASIGTVYLKRLETESFIDKNS